MKSVKNLILVALCFLTFNGAVRANEFTVVDSLNKDVTVIESTDSNSGYTVIESGSMFVGITRFTPDQVLTAGRVNVASYNHTVASFQHTQGSMLDKANIYYYLGTSWLIIDENGVASKVEDEWEIDYLNEQVVFYVNNVPKMMSMEYSSTSPTGESLIPTTGLHEYDKLVTYDGKIVEVPAVSWMLSFYDDVTGLPIDAYYLNYTQLQFVHAGSLNGTIEPLEVDGSPKGTPSGSTITYENVVIPWYPSSPSLNRRSGNRVGVVIKPGILLEELYSEQDLSYDKIKVVINGVDHSDEEYTWDVDGAGRTEFHYWPRFTEDNRTSTVEIFWTDDYSQTFVIELADTAILQVADEGSLSVQDAYTKKSGVTIDGNGLQTITFSEEIPYYLSDTTVGRVSAGNRVGLKITAPAKYTDYDNIEVTVISADRTSPETVKWSDDKSGAENTFDFWPLVNAGFEGEVIVKWEEGNTQTFKFVADANANYGTTDVINEAQLRDALASTSVNTINILEDIEDITSRIVINKDVTINGNNKTLSFTEAINSTTAGSRQGLIIQTSQNVTIKNLKVEMSANVQEANTWNGVYGIQAYRSSDVVFENVTVTGADGGILVNASTVTLEGSIDVSGNQFGGIEVSVGKDENGATLSEPAVLNADNAEFTNSTEEYGKPTIWTDSEGVTVNSSLTKVLKGTQNQYYVEERNSTDTVMNSYVPSSIAVTTGELNKPSVITKNASATLTSGTAYTNVRLEIEVTEVPVGATNENIKVWAMDTQGGIYNIIETGWGPVAGFPIDVGYSATTDLQIEANVAGTYKADLVLYDVSGTKTEIERITITLVVE